MDSQFTVPPIDHRPSATFSALVAAKLHRFKVLIRKHWWIPLLTICLAMAVQSYRLLSEPVVYVSNARMMVAPQVRLPDKAVYLEETTNFFGTQIELMRSGEVRKRARERVAALHPEMQPSWVDYTVFQSPNTSIFLFQATGGDPAYTQAFLDGLLHSFIRFKDEMRLQTSDITFSAINEQLLRLEAEMKDHQNIFFEFQKNNDVVVLQEQGNIAASFLTELERDLAHKQREARLLEMFTLDQSLAAAEPGAPAADNANSEASIESPRNSPTPAPAAEYLRAQQEIQMLRTQLEDLARFLRPRHPKLVQIREDLDRQETLLGVYRAQSIEQLRNRRETLAIEIRNTQNSRTEWEQRALETNRIMAEYNNIRANLERVKNTHERLLDTVRNMDMSTNLGQISISVLEYASPAQAVKQGIFKALATGASVGLALGVGILLALDKLDDRINSLSEFKDFFDQEVLGQLPFEPDGENNRRGILGDDSDRIIYAEAMRNIRSALLYMPMAEPRPRTILVTSAIPGEGKSTITSNLAITMARMGSRVLLIDADLRKGVQHSIFNKPSNPGLAEVLDGHVDWRTARMDSGWDNLELITRGKTERLMNELLLGSPFDNFLQEASQEHDIILLDTPPVLAADDSPSMAAKVDGCLLVARASFTSSRMVERSLDTLQQRQARIIGFILNAVDISQPEYYHYRYYKDYHDRDTAS